MAVSSKMTLIRWKEADLLAAQRELDIINEFLVSYPDNKLKLDAARQQLREADEKLRVINTKNLLKSVMTLSLETICTTADAVSLGKAAGSAFITHGLRSSAGAAALDRLQDKVKDDGRAALGVDDETLTKPRVVKIKAVSDAARATFPVLAKVQEAFALTEAQVRQIKIDTDGVAFAEGNSTGPIYYKNGLIRDAIALALAKLDTLSIESGGGKTDADGNKILVQEEVERLTAEIAVLYIELAELNTQWREEEKAARLAANEAAAIVPPSRSPSPESLRQGTDSDADFQARVAAIQSAALNAWNTESPVLRASIAARKILINTAQSELDDAVATYVTSVRLESFLTTYGGDAATNGNPSLDPNTTASYFGATKSYAEIEQWITDVTPSGPALPAMIAQADALADQYTVLQNLKNEFDCLALMVYDSHVSMGDSNWRDMDYTAGSTQIAVEEKAVTLNQHLNLFSTALVNAKAQRDQLALATDTWSEVIEGVKNVGEDGGAGDGSTVGGLGRELDTNIVDAEAALAELISRGTAWENLLAAATGLVFEPLAQGSNDGGNPPRGRLGYYTSKGTAPDTYIPVVLHAFDMQTYNFSMLAAIETPGVAGLAAARDLRAKYDVLAAAAPAIKSAYDAAWIKYQVAYTKAAEFAGEGDPGLPVLSDWAEAAAYTSEKHPVNASAVTDQAIRYRDLYHTSNSRFATSLSGGPSVENEATISWCGLPQMKQLTDPGLDDPATYLPHRLADMKAVIVEDGETWITLPAAEFDSHYIPTSDAIWVLIHLGNAWADDYTTPTLTANKLLGDLEGLKTAYHLAHPLPTITAQPVGGTIVSGVTHQLSVTATSDLLTYQWLMSMSDDANGGWQVLTGETASTLTSPALTASRWFHVIIRNPSGEVTSENAHVIVSGGTSSTLVFTSANSTTGQVGTPFTWTFTSNPAGMINIPPNITIPPGLVYENGTLSGTPTSAGTWDLTVNVSLPPNPPNPPATATQSFHLMISLSDTGISGDPYEIAFVGTPYDLRVGNQVTFDLNRLLAAGETLKVGGKIPSGLKYNATTGLLTGIITGKPGTYLASIQILQGKTVVRTIGFPITVLEFPATLIGNFNFLMEDAADSVPSGVCKITITNSNGWSATLESAGASKKRSAKGSFILAEGLPVAPITAVFPAINATSSVPGVPAVTVNIPIDGSTPTITGTYDGGTLRGFSLAKVGEMPPATVVYSLVLDAGEQNGITVPAGLGWMKGKVSNKGIGTFKGLLGDGTSASITLGLSAYGQAVLWSQPYKKKTSYIGGIVTLGNLGLTTPGEPPLTDEVWWKKAEDLTTLSYPNGFAGMSVTIGTSRWTAPATAAALGAALGWSYDRMAEVTIDGGGLSNQGQQTTIASLPTEFTLDDKFALITSQPDVTTLPVSAPLVVWKGKVSKTDGAMSGTLMLPVGFSSDFPSGSAAASGVLVQDEQWGSITGCGQIKVPATGPKGSFKTASIVLGQ